MLIELVRQIKNILKMFYLLQFQEKRKGVEVSHMNLSCRVGTPAFACRRLPVADIIAMLSCFEIPLHPLSITSRLYERHNALFVSIPKKQYSSKLPNNSKIA